jgi:protease-4
MTLLATLALGASLAGCLPNRIVLDLAPSDGELQERPVLADGETGATGPKVALIDVTGLISYEAGGAIIAGRGNAVDDLVARLDKARKDPQVRAVILRINSPGGTVAATETMYLEVMRFRKETSKPVVVSMAEVAASGGYYLSLAADKVYAQESTITGSIGVIIQTFNLSKGMSMIGLEARAVTSGPNKDMGNPFEPPEESQYELLQGIVDDFYEGFQSRVAERRTDMPADWRTSVADGRVFTGRQALAVGLVDANGDLHDAFEAAKELASIPKARLVKYHTEGREPASAYANAGSPLPGADAAGSGVHVSLNLAESLLPRAGFYYLWLPPNP